MIRRKLLGARKYRFHKTIMWRHPRGNERCVLETVSPEDVFSRAKAHRHCALIDLASGCVADVYIRGGSDNLMILVQAGQKSRSENQGTNRSRRKVCGLDFFVAPARNLNAYRAMHPGRALVSDGHGDHAERP